MFLFNSILPSVLRSHGVFLFLLDFYFLLLSKSHYIKNTLELSYVYSRE